MSLPAVALLVLWVVSFPFAFRQAARSMLDDSADWGWVLMVIFMGGYLAAVGAPLIWPYKFFVRLGQRDPDSAARFARRLAGEDDETKVLRLEREKRERDRYIAQLEREVGIE